MVTKCWVNVTFLASRRKKKKKSGVKTKHYMGRDFLAKVGYTSGPLTFHAQSRRLIHQKSSIVTSARAQGHDQPLSLPQPQPPRPSRVTTSITFADQWLTQRQSNSLHPRYYMPGRLKESRNHIPKTPHRSIICRVLLCAA